MFVQKNVRRNYQWQKIIMLQKTVQTKIHMDPIRMRMLKMLPARISQIKIQAIKMHPVKIRLTGMQKNAYESDRNAYDSSKSCHNESDKY